MPASKSISTVAQFRVLVVVARPLDIAELPRIADKWARVNGLATVRAPARIDIFRPPTIDDLGHIKPRITSVYTEINISVKVGVAKGEPMMLRRP